MHIYLKPYYNKVQNINASIGEMELISRARNMILSLTNSITKEAKQ